jgi:hypothetical protein
MFACGNARSTARFACRLVSYKSKPFSPVGAGLRANVRLRQCLFNGTIRLQACLLQKQTELPCRSRPAGELSREVMLVARHDSLAGLSPTKASRFPLVGAGLPANVRLRQCPFNGAIRLQACFLQIQTERR